MWTNGLMPYSYYRGICLTIEGASRNNVKEKIMKSSMTDKVQGAVNEAKGTVKEAAGIITGNSRLEAKGKAEKIGGKIQEKIGQIKQVVGK